VLIEPIVTVKVENPEASQIYMFCDTEFRLCNSVHSAQMPPLFKSQSPPVVLPLFLTMEALSVPLTAEEEALFQEILAKKKALTATVRYGIFADHDVHTDDQRSRWIRVEAVGEAKRRFMAFPPLLLARYFHSDPQRFRVGWGTTSGYWVRAL